MISHYDAHLVFRSQTILGAANIADTLNLDDECEDVEIVAHPEEPGAWYVYATIGKVPATEHEDVVKFCSARWKGMEWDKMWVSVVDT